MASVTNAIIPRTGKGNPNSTARTQSAFEWGYAVASIIIATPSGIKAAGPNIRIGKVYWFRILQNARVITDATIKLKTEPEIEKNNDDEFNVLVT